MSAVLEHVRVSLRLHFRNTMALIYGYAFPLIFLVAFWVLYRHERVPLVRHMGELLTVTVLGGACFGLPTTLVSEREKGVWRRYRLAPVPTWAVVASTIAARYLILLSAGLLQLAVALAVGMTLPAHPAGLFVAFTVVAFALIGLGLVVAALADNVPAVQALGQCIFLPMLIIGGVAVQLASLPAWAQHVSAFFPGRYAVESLQETMSGGGFSAARFDLAALGLMGAAAAVAGGMLFRWDAQQRFAARSGKAWLLPVFGAWAAVGLLAESRGKIAVRDAGVGTVSEVAATAAKRPVEARKPQLPWMTITGKDVAALEFDHLPPDEGIVAPIAAADDEPEDFVRQQIETLREKLPSWPPADDDNEVQAVRNLLCVCAVPDALQIPAERYVPRVVYQALCDRYPKDKLIQLLTWIALHPEEGPVIDEIQELGIEGAVGDPSLVRERVYLYAVKFVARLTGRSGGK